MEYWLSETNITIYNTHCTAHKPGYRRDETGHEVSNAMETKYTNVERNYVLFFIVCKPAKQTKQPEYT